MIPSTTEFGKLDDVIFSTAFSYQVIKPIADGTCFMVVNAPKTVPLGMDTHGSQQLHPKTGAGSAGPRDIAPKGWHGNNSPLNLKRLIRDKPCETHANLGFMGLCVS
jgi:hypothetical protein